MCTCPTASTGLIFHKGMAFIQIIFIITTQHPEICVNLYVNLYLNHSLETFIYLYMPEKKKTHDEQSYLNAIDRTRLLFSTHDSLCEEMGYSTSTKYIGNIGGKNNVLKKAGYVRNPVGIPSIYMFLLRNCIPIKAKENWHIRNC